MIFWKTRLTIKSYITVSLVSIIMTSFLVLRRSVLFKNSSIIESTKSPADKIRTSYDKSRCNMNDGAGWLNRNNFSYNNSAVHWSMVNPINEGICPLHLYTVKDTVTCFESAKLIAVEDLPLRFVFIGDSRGRQQFFNFLKFIPDYDLNFLEWDNAIETVVDLHIDRSVTSPLLDLHVSFLWRPVLKADWIMFIKEWLKHPPYLIIISLGIHHLSTLNVFAQFQEILIQLLPSLRRLANQTELIWMNQYPILPAHKYFYPKSDNSITSGNMEAFNNLVRSILKNSGIKIWDSGNPPVEEYVRSCGQLQWTDRMLIEERIYRNDYFNCFDKLHPSFVALSHSTQLLLNHICNRFLLRTG